MVIISDNNNYWNLLSKYKELPYTFILTHQDNVNWLNIFDYHKYKTNAKFIIKFEKYWINNNECKHIIFNYTLFDELTISFYPNFIDWRSNIIYNNLPIDFIILYKDYILKQYIYRLPYDEFIDLCSKNKEFYKIFMLDYIRFNKKLIHIENLIEFLLQPKLMYKYIILGYDYEGNKINLE
jgi:hypothetical protein